MVGRILLTRNRTLPFYRVGGVQPFKPVIYSR